jgi:hypothetical protein
MQDTTSACEKRLDLADVRPVSFAGGTAVLAPSYNRLDSGIEIDAGEQPVGTAGVYSPRDLEHALREADFDGECIGHALNVEFRGPNATKLVSIAEQQAGHAEVLADGGEQLDEQENEAEDDPEARPEACLCRTRVLLDGCPPCPACADAGFETINDYDVPPADGGKGLPLEDR